MALSIGLCDGGKIILGLNGLRGSCDQVCLAPTDSSSRASITRLTHLRSFSVLQFPPDSSKGVYAIDKIDQALRRNFL